jgi:NADH-quinone oxidoreductase subunit E
MLTDDTKKEIEAQIAIYGRREAACIGSMLIAQRHVGWISDETLEDLAKFLGMTVEELDGVATFYNEIYRKPVGRHVILVCDSVVCWIMGYDGVREHLTRRLGIDLGQTTPDGRFTLLPVQCLGACDHAPAMTVDGELYIDLDPEKIDKILEAHT